VNVAIVDDLARDREKLAERLRRYGAMRNAEIGLTLFESGEKLLESFRPYLYTAIFLDVYMDGLSGPETAARIRELDDRTALVFMTTSEDHRPEAFRAHAYGYILKDEPEEAVFQLMDDLLRLRGRDAEKRLAFTADRREVSLPFSEIVCVEADAHYLTVTDARGETYRTRMTFAECERTLRDGRFLTLLRGVLVNMDHIADLSGGTCLLQYGGGQRKLPVSVRTARQTEQVWRNYLCNKVREGGMRR
jgi:DNA-binding LytR/AlgR family response regulator